VVLMDMSLKGSEDGLALTRFIRSEDRWKDLPVIATTAHAFAEDRENALNAGCTAYLAKPFDHRQLIALMDRLVRARS
jgi:CheY-like chemotaxis protein